MDDDLLLFGHKTKKKKKNRRYRYSCITMHIKTALFLFFFSKLLFQI